MFLITETEVILINSTYLKSIIKLLSGTSAAQVLFLITIPFMTRLYGADNFGILGIFMSCISILTIIGTGRYDAAIAIPEIDEDAIFIIIIAFCLSVFSGISLSIILLFYTPSFLISLTSAKWSIPAGLIIMAAVTITENWLNRKGNVSRIAKSRFIGTLCLVVMQLLLGYIFPTGNSLILGFLFGIMITAVINFSAIYKIFGKVNFSIKTVIEIGRRYSNFPKFLLVAHLLNTMSNHLPTLLIGNYYGVLIAGWYTIANRALSFIDLIPTVVGQVFYPKAAHEYNKNGNCYITFMRTTKALAAITIAVFPLLFFYSQSLFEIAFGTGWDKAGEIARLIMPIFILRFIISPISGIFNIANKQNWYLFRQIVMLIMVVIGFYYGIFKSNFTLSINLYVIAYVIGYLIDFVILHKLSKGDA